MAGDKVGASWQTNTGRVSLFISSGRSSTWMLSDWEKFPCRHAATANMQLRMPEWTHANMSMDTRIHDTHRHAGDVWTEGIHIREQWMFSTEALFVFRWLVWIQMLGLTGYAIQCHSQTSFLILWLSPGSYSDGLPDETPYGHYLDKKKKIWMGLNTVGNIWEEINDSAKICNTCLVVFKHFKYVTY